MRRTVTALAAAATMAAATVATPGAANAGGRDWIGPAIIGGIAAGILVGTQIARPQYPGPVYFEYAQPGPTYYEVYPPQYFGPPAPIDNCWRWRHGYRQRVC